MTKNKAGEYQDRVVPQDACQHGNLQMFKKRSTQQSLTQHKLSSKTHRVVAGALYLTGLSPSGRLLSASSSRSSFYGVPLIAWTPSTGAATYDVEWSKTSYPWRKAGGLQTPATSALLLLSRARGTTASAATTRTCPGTRSSGGPARFGSRSPSRRFSGGRRLGSHVRRLATNEEGFTLVEMLIAMTIMAIGIAALVAGFSSGILAVNRAGTTSTAGSLADKQMEGYRQAGFTSRADRAAGSGYAVRLDGRYLLGAARGGAGRVSWGT